ncbi:MAG: tRNA (adenosine(37)-N6)-threonylcarbamoyltransferase complex dimerization subunit type 1 TsaB [Lentisphaeria bacterium]
MIEAALDTSHGMALAIIEDGEVLASDYIKPQGRQNRETLTPWLKETFANCELIPNRVARWTAGLGPGSFTGIRIGLGFIKGVCLQSAAQIRGIPTSYAIARQSAADLKTGDQITVLNDARRKEVITTIYRKEPKQLTCMEQAFIPDSETLNKICQETTRLVTMQADQVGPNLPEIYRAKVVDLQEMGAEYFLDAPPELYQIETVDDLSTQARPVYVRPAVHVKPKAMRK